MFGLFPIWSGWISQKFGSSHKGIDIGFLTKDGANLPVRAWNDGTVLASGKDAEGGVYVVLKHSNGQWTGYWHLIEGSNIPKGTKVKQGDTVGIRGNTGKSGGPHLHFVLTKESMSEGFSISKMNSNAIDPLNWVYKLPTDNIEKAENHDQYPLPLKPVLPEPTIRNEDKHQVEVFVDTLRIREKASTSSAVVGYMTKGIFDITRQVQGSRYIWDKLGDYWIATNDAEGWTRDLPAKMEVEKRCEKLTAENADLQAQISTLTSEKGQLDQELIIVKASLETSKKRISKAMEVLNG